MSAFPEQPGEDGQEIVDIGRRRDLLP